MLVVVMLGVVTMFSGYGCVRSTVVCYWWLWWFYG